MKQKIKERIELINRGKVPEGYKKTKVGIIPKDWQFKKLGDITISSDYGTSASSNSINGYPVLRMGNLQNGNIDTSDLVYIELLADEFKKLKLHKGDILINRTNSYDLVGKVSLFNLDGDFICASYIVRFKINKELVTPSYINAYMNLDTSQNFIKILSTKGVQQANINPSVLKKYFKIPFPKKIDEQNQISNILSFWDKAIELKEKLVEQKKVQKKGLMQLLLTGKVRLPGFNDKWKHVKLGDILNFKKKDSLSNPQDYYLLTVKLHLKGIETTNKKPNVTTKGRPYYLREPGELLIGRQNFHNGGIGIVPKEMVGYIASNAISSVETKKGNLKFYYYYLSNNNFYKKVGHIIGGTGQKEISEANMKKLKLIIPSSIKEQNAITNILSTIDKEIELLGKELSSLKQQKKGLMQLLLTGKVRVR